MKPFANCKLKEERLQTMNHYRAERERSHPTRSSDSVSMQADGKHTSSDQVTVVNVCAARPSTNLILA